MKIYLALLLLIATANLACAAESITKRLTPGLQPAQSLEGEFRQQRFINVLKLPLISSGTFSYSSTKGIQWQTLKPLQSIIQINLQQGVLAGKESGSLKPVATSRVIADIFLSIFSGDSQQITHIFQIEQQPTDIGWLLKLVPSDAGMRDYLETVYLRGSKYVEWISLEESNGDRTEINLYNLKAD